MACNCEPLDTNIFEPMGSDPNTLETILGAPGLRGKIVTPLPKNGLPTDFIRSIINTNPDLKEPFFALDLGMVASLMDQWTRTLPAIRPFYTVKCNPDPAFLGAMAALGSGFDCASRAEIESVLSLGVHPDLIIYGNPCKSVSHIKYAASVGVNTTTFDSKEEIKKIQMYHPKCNLLIRVKVDDCGSRWPLGAKYGALLDEFEPLLSLARAAELVVTGVAFHVESGATDSNTYRAAIAVARKVFDLACRLGLPRLSVLNIGGGFSAGLQFEAAAIAVKLGLKECFQNEPGLTVIAEPGRFFAEDPFTLAATVIGKRVRGALMEYWINDGIYGSFNCVLYDYPTVDPTPLAFESDSTNPTQYNSTVFGQTCAALDTVARGLQLPEMEVNDWLVFLKMGAYRAACGSDFNGFSTSAIKTHLAYSGRDNWKVI